MFSTIILILTLLAAGAIAGAFVLALKELNRIDDISEKSSHSG